MTDEDWDSTLDDLFSSKGSPPLTDSVVDAFLASPALASPESASRVMNLFVGRVLAELHPEPVKAVGAEPFGRWLETVRRKAGLAIVDIAAAIGKEASYIERLESGSVWPWASDPKDIALLISLFRLHLYAASALIQRSFVVSKAQVTGDVSARAHGGKMTKERGNSARRALDMFLARNAKAEPLEKSIADWLVQLRGQLEECGKTDLIN